MRVIPTLNFRFFSLCVLRALCVSVVAVRNPRGLAIRLTRSILTEIALHSPPGRSWRACRHWRPGEGAWISGAVGCKAAIFEDGNTWTGSKRMAGPKGGKSEHFGVRDYSSPQTLQHCLHRDQWRQEHEVSKDDRRAAKLRAIFLIAYHFRTCPSVLLWHGRLLAPVLHTLVGYLLSSL